MDPVTLEKLYFALFIAFIILLVAGCQWVTTYYFDIKGAIVSAFILSFLGSMAWRYFVLFAAAQNPTGSTRDASDIPLFGLAFFICLVSIAILSVGVYYLVEFYKTGSLHKPIFFTWLAVVVITPTAYFGIKAAKEYSIKQDILKNYADLYLEIIHFNDYPIYIEHLEFSSEQNDRTKQVRVYNRLRYYPPRQRDSLNASERVFSSDITAFDERISIPVNSDHFILSYYSFAEDRYYQDTIPFDLSQYTYVNELSGQKHFKSINLFILPDGNGRIIIPAENTYFPYSKVKSVHLSNEKRQQYIDRFIRDHELENSLAYQVMMEQINTSGVLQERMDMLTEEFSWELDIQAYGDLMDVSIKDVRDLKYDVDGKWYKETSNKVLPKEIEVEVKNKEGEGFARIYIFPEKQKLYHVVNELRESNNETPVTIKIEIKSAEEDGIKMMVESKDQAVTLDEMHLNIVKFDD